MVITACTNYTHMHVQTTVEELQCQCSGIGRRKLSSAMSLPKSFVCSTRLLTNLLQQRLTTIPKNYGYEIDSINARIYDTLNNGVYRCGFATTQKAYKKVFTELFACLDDLESGLTNRRFLLGNRITEADWRLFPTLIRFDAVYYSHFKTNMRRIRDYPELFGYTRDLYQQPGVAKTVNIEHFKQHYYYSHETINPSRIVPEGPELEFRWLLIDVKNVLANQNTFPRVCRATDRTD